MLRIHRLFALAMLCCSQFASAADIYPVTVGADHRHLADQTGAPFLVQGDAAWSLISGLTNEEAEKYLEDRRSKGFNSVIVNLIEHQFRGPTAAIENRRLGIACVKGGIVARKGAALVIRTCSEVAVI